GVGMTVVYAVVPGLVIFPYGAAFVPVKPYLWIFAVALALLALSNILINYFLSIGNARFAIPLAGACVIETVLIALFHSGPGQIVAMVLVTMAVLALALLAMYGVERVRSRVPI
ncbi:MAG TPA: hypothetical protein VNA65_05650, partial [Candidatus Dormibacteraeota bacterium]|nr:hypothetical protein [Candidatus Dormibacteraeota bacterium]